MTTVIFQAQLALVSRADALDFGILGFCNLAPIIPFAPIGGVLADRYDRRTIMVVSQAGIGAVAAVLAGVTAVGGASSPTVLYGFAAIFGTGMAINGPALQALTVNVAPQEAVHSSVSLSAIVTNLTRLVGPAAGGVVVSSLGVAAGFGIYAVTSLVAAALFLGIGYTDSEEPASVHRAGSVRYVMGRPVILVSLSLIALCAVFGSSLTLLMPAFTAEAYSATGVEFVWLTTALGCGALLGTSLILSATEPPTLRSGTSSTAVLGTVIVALGLSPTRTTGVLASLAIGAAIFHAVTALNIVIHDHTSEELRGRVMGMFMISWAGLMPIGALALGALGRAVGVRMAVVTAGILVLAGAAMSVVARKLSPAGACDTGPGRS